MIFGNGLVAVLATARSGHDLGDIRSGATSGVRGMCVGMWVQGLGRGWAAVCGAAGPGSGPTITLRDRSETENLRPVFSKLGEFSDL